MAYTQPHPVALSIMRIADMQLTGGNKIAAAQTLYGNGYTWSDLTNWQAANYKVQRAPAEMSLPPALRGMGILGLRRYPLKKQPLRPSMGAKLMHMAGLGTAVPVPAAPAATAPESVTASLAPAGSMFITPELALNLKDGNIYYQAMKIGIIPALITAVVVKGVMFGGSKVGSMFSRKTAAA
jgi:hypothetical protein